MITFQNIPVGAKVLELGGGENPHPITTCNVDIVPGPKVNFSWDLETLPWPLSDNEWDVVIAFFVFEHLSWRVIPNAMKELFRVAKPGGKVFLVLPNTKAQFEWIESHGNGWDSKELFESASCVIFGDQDYPSNSHRSYWSPKTTTQLFEGVGFSNINIHPYGARDTDLVVDAQKPATEEYLREYNIPYLVGNKEEIKETQAEWKQIELHAKPFTALVSAPSELSQSFSTMGETESTLKEQNEMYEAVLKGAEQRIERAEKALEKVPAVPREQLFDKAYFNGGGKVGGYAKEGYWDYPVHWATFQHILDRKPESVLEVGAARGYILKRIQDQNIRGYGLEVSPYAVATRATEGVILHDVCKGNWSSLDKGWDLCYSVATLEHIPEEYLRVVIGEMERTCKRGLHGIDFGEADTGFDKTHCTLRLKSWWEAKFKEVAPNWPVEIVDKESLEVGSWPNGVREGDGKLKVNIGSFLTQFYFGWENLDIHDLSQFAQTYGYKFKRVDVRQGLPYSTGSVDLIFMSHFLEHLSRKESCSLLRECRRVIKPSGGMRILTPDAKLLAKKYLEGTLGDYDIQHEGCNNSPQPAQKLWELLCQGHQDTFDVDSLCFDLQEAGFVAEGKAFRQSNHSQILKEATELGYELSLFVDCVPKIG